MQQTALDRWLRRKFIYVSHVYCNTLPHDQPSGVQLEETDPESGSRYLYRYTLNDERALSELTARLEVENITYTSRISERTGLLARLFNNPHKSFTMRIFWIIFIIAIISIAFSGLPVMLWRELSAPPQCSL